MKVGEHEYTAAVLGMLKRARTWRALHPGVPVHWVGSAGQVLGAYQPMSRGCVQLIQAMGAGMAEPPTPVMIHLALLAMSQADWEVELDLLAN